MSTYPDEFKVLEEENERLRADNKLRGEEADEFMAKYESGMDYIKKLEDENGKLKAELADLHADLDAECRVSQMLLAGQKKLQAELATAKEENEKYKKALEEINMHWCPHENSPTCPEIADQALKA